MFQEIKASFFHLLATQEYVMVIEGQGIFSFGTKVGVTTPHSSLCLFEGVT